MKRIVTITALALAIGLPSVSHAGSNIFGVNLPAGKSEVRSSASVQGSSVEKDLSSFYITPKILKSQKSHKAVGSLDKAKGDRSVFGVKVPYRSES